ncbi:MAG: hypothetical protein L6R41_000733 [Letrouitia leprolyta]|nr:MAG: hypothetical protein L6R41_000733 [Letrouitia leprolyta]
MSFHDQSVSPAIPSPPLEQQDLMLTKPAQPDHVEDKKITTLEAKIATLKVQIDDTRAKLQHDAAKLIHPDATKTVQNHIRLLREYNDIRDIGTSLMGIIADNRRVQMKCIYKEFDVDQKD